MRGLGNKTATPAASSAYPANLPKGISIKSTPVQPTTNQKAQTHYKEAMLLQSLGSQEDQPMITG